MIVLTCFYSALSAQKDNSDFREYARKQREAVAQYKEIVKADLKNYRDSLNTAFSKYLREKWEEFDLYRQERGFEPMPEPPVYDPDKPKPDVTPLLVPVNPTPEPEPQPQLEPEPQPEPDQPISIPVAYPVKADFFGIPIELQSIEITERALSGISEKEVADYWVSLSQLSTNKFSEDIIRIKNAFELNDWGIYQLTGAIFRTHFSRRSENEQVVFSIFMLNQLGYRARIGRADDDLVPLIALKNRLSNTSYFRFGNEDNPVFLLHD
jgi:hypothetical protein